MPSSLCHCIEYHSVETHAWPYFKNFSMRKTSKILPTNVLLLAGLPVSASQIMRLACTRSWVQSPTPPFQRTKTQGIQYPVAPLHIIFNSIFFSKSNNFLIISYMILNFHLYLDVFSACITLLTFDCAPNVSFCLTPSNKP